MYSASTSRSLNRWSKKWLRKGGAAAVGSGWGEEVITLSTIMMRMMVTKIKKMWWALGEDKK